MALGFGFNKTKVLSSAEKYVQQGKLQNAIAEYEKVIKEDPKDLTVLNTIGDLYARVGQTDQAVTYFKKVGDTYAAEGFTVKAIAMYKKLTKLSPSAIECVQKLAELYTNQGLYNDARAQYMQVADSYRRSGSPEQAAKVFEKILELDPENAGMQSKLADLYVSIGKKDEAKNIYFRAADQLRQRNALDGADEALGRVLALDPDNMRAKEMRGQIAVEAGDFITAATYFEQLPDVDSRPDALRALLHAYLKQKLLDEAEPIARKLLNVHNDDSGIGLYAEGLITAGKASDAVKLYDEFSDRMLAGNAASLEKLHSAISRVRDDSQALESLRRLFVKAGDTTHTAEVMELLAHASAQAGDFERARDLYRELADLEPENPLHSQNYKQILTRLGEDSTARALSAEEATQAFMVEELEPVETVIEQQYPEAVNVTIQAALTEAELFSSYNVPAKAIPPLESALERAPEDVRLNQALLSLYVRMNRFADAARVSSVLQRVFAEAGHEDDASRFADITARYADKAGSESPTQTTPAAMKRDAAAPASMLDVASPDWPEFQLDFESPDHAAFATEAADLGTAAPTADVQTPSVEAHIAEFNFESADLQQAFAETGESAAAETTTQSPDVAPASTTHEFDLSDEWETIVSAPASAEPPPQVFDFFAEVPSPASDAAQQTANPLEADFGVALPIASDAPDDVPGTAQEIIEEACFYLAQGMQTEARAAIDKLAAHWPDHTALGRLRQQLPADSTATDVVAPFAVAQPAASVSVFDLDALPQSSDFLAPEFTDGAASDNPLHADQQDAAFAVEAAFTPATDASPLSAIFETPTAPAPEALDAESPIALEPITPVAAQAATSIATSSDVLGEFVLELDQSLGEDFHLGGSPKPSAPQAFEAEPQPAPVAAMAASAAAVTAAPPQTAPARPLSATLDIAPDNSAGEVNSVLADMFAEFKEDVEEGTEQTEDPDTHYNLGVAFKEMGLLDEAIGELQKVAQSIERGAEFSQTMQAYTWLANCFVEKGVPEASYKWYERALKVAPDEETRTAIHYELACAYENAGDRRQALSHFMEVYGSNIDYRDVAERIKALKS